MVNFHGLAFNKKEPVYPQLANYIKKLIMQGILQDYEELPSRRELAVSLSINPNTVQKAYKLLEDEGIIQTVSNVKSVIRVNDDICNSIKSQFYEETVQTFAKECKENGLSFQKTISLLTKYWED